MKAVGTAASVRVYFGLLLLLLRLLPPFFISLRQFPSFLSSFLSFVLLGDKEASSFSPSLSFFFSDSPS